MKRSIVLLLIIYGIVGCNFNNQIGENDKSKADLDTISAIDSTEGEYDVRCTLFDLKTSRSDSNMIRKVYYYFQDTVLIQNEIQTILHENYFQDSIIHFSYICRDQSIHINNYDWPIIDTVSIAMLNDSIVLFRSKFDLEHSNDEEAELFWNHELGLVGVYSVWANIYIYEPLHKTIIDPMKFCDFIYDWEFTQTPPPSLDSL